MIFIDFFRFPSRDKEEDFFNPKSLCFKTKNYRTCYTSKYPFDIFFGRELPDLNFDDITIFCGNNGSGKSTILNVIAEKLMLTRGTLYNRSEFFDDYTDLCSYNLTKTISPDSKIITSDDVFDKVLEIRRLNEGVDNKRNELLKDFITERNKVEPNRLKGIDDYERWKEASDKRNKNTTQSSYLRSRLIRNVQERSNGESALSFFVDAIADGGLYLLDEPENSLSPSNQIQLKYFIEDSVHYHNCQFIISTHSPFLLSLRRAKIYDIDSVPVCVRKWNELGCVSVYHDFFKEYEKDFQ